MCPGFDSGLVATCGLSLLLVLYSALRGFSPGSPEFSPFLNSNIPKFQFDQMQELPENHFRVSGASCRVNIINYYTNQSEYFHNQCIVKTCPVEELRELGHWLMCKGRKE